MISLAILSKYNMTSLEEAKERHGDSLSTELTFYQTFLIQTDHIPNKITEYMLNAMLGKDSDMIGASLAIFIAEMELEYKEIIDAREFARNRINEINTEVAKLTREEET